MNTQQTVEQYRDAVQEPLSTWLESSAWTLALSNANHAVWREYRGEGSMSVMRNHLIDREFVRVLEMPMASFLDELGGELADEIAALIGFEEAA